MSSLSRNVRAILVVVVMVNMVVSGLVAFAILQGPSTIAAPSASGASSTTTTTNSTSTVNDTALASLTARVNQLESGLAAAGVQPDLLRLPNLNPQPSNPSQAVISYGYAKAPAPMGVSYYGISDASGTPVGTVVDSSSVMGEISITNLSAFYMDSTSPDQWGAQLNALVNNATLQGASKYDFWTQNVLAYYGHNDTLQFVENTWNFSSTAEAFPTSGQSSIVTNDTDEINYEGIIIGEGPYFYAPAPFNLTFYLNSSIVPTTYIVNQGTSNQAIVYAGDQELWYNYSFSDAATGFSSSGTYDWMIFNSTNPAHPWTKNGPGGLPFEASGTKDNAATGLAADYEMDLGIGAFDGATQNVFDVNATATEAYVNDCSGRTSSAPATCAATTGPGSGYTYTTVPAAYDAGSQTGETTSGISEGFSGTTAIISTGPSIIHGLWGYAGESGLNPTTTTVTNGLAVSGSPLALTAQPYIFLFLESTSFTSQGYQWAPDAASWTIMDGTYDYEAMLSDYQEQTGSITVGATPTTLTATLPYATTSGVYTPLWAFSNAQLAGISTSGAGTIGSQYAIFNNPTASCTDCGSATNANLSSVFNAPNDYYFPTFSAIQFMNTSAYVNINDPAPTAIWSGSGSSAVQYFLQMEFYEVSNLTLSNGTAIRGMTLQAIFYPLASQNIIPQAAVMFWNSTHNLIERNTFVAWKLTNARDEPADDGFVPNQNLFFYSADTAVADNVVWGNTFKNPPGVALGTTYGGISVAENGDLIYNNEFAIDNPIVPMYYNPYTELCYANAEGYCTLWPYVDTWNIANQSATIGTVFNGFPIGGSSIAGSAYQGGNFWESYGNTLNPFGTGPYLSYFSYNELVAEGVVAADTQPSIYGGGDQVPLLPGVGANPGYLYSTVFTQTGLSASASWKVTVTGTTSWSTTIGSIAKTQTGPSAAAILLPQGTYTYTITSPTGTNPTWNLTSSSTGSLTSSSSTTVPLAFQARWAITITKTGAVGLPSGTKWFVNYTGPLAGALSGTGNTFVFDAPNGTYTFTVQTAKYAATPSSGVVTVAGSAPQETIVSAFSHSNYQVTFTELGLAASTSWRVFVNGSYHSGTAPNPIVVGGLLSGTYNYTVTSISGYSVAPRTGTFTIAAANVTLPLTFSFLSWALTFTETGLPAETTWVAVVGANLYTSDATTIVVSLPNATYDYALAALSGGYTASPSNGSKAINGASANVAVTFTAIAPTYTLYFTESNLPAGTEWSVTVTGVGTQSGSTPTLSFTGLSAGPYSYMINTLAGYTATPSSGTVTVATASAAVQIAFTPMTITVTFTESGLTAGTLWVVVFGGVVYYSTGTTIAVTVPSGTYDWQLGIPSGYGTSGVTSGTASSTQSVDITFT